MQGRYVAVSFADSRAAWYQRRLGGRMRSPLPFWFAACLLFAAACAQPAPYTWVQHLPPQPDPRTITTISPGDIVDVRVFGQEAMSAKGPVRLDGTMTLPLLGQVTVAGQRPE